MKKVLVMLAVVLTTAALGGCGAPNPEEICAHIEGVYGKDPEASKYKAFDKASCVRNGGMKRELPAYRAYGACAKQASTIAGINECAKAMDAALK